MVARGEDTECHVVEKSETWSGKRAFGAQNQGYRYKKFEIVNSLNRVDCFNGIKLSEVHSSEQALHAPYPS